MAVLLYSNGIIEEYKPKGYTFTEEELRNFFKEYDKVRSYRLFEVPNTWCLWGENKKNIDVDFNRVATETVDEPVFSDILFIHDTEIDQTWNLIDNIIYKDYKVFVADIIDLLNAISEELLNSVEENGQQSENQIILSFLGPKNKRNIFEFDIDSQKPYFFIDDNMKIFADKVLEHFKSKRFKFKLPFTIFDDPKTSIIIHHDKVEYFLNKIIEFYGKKENYETCEYLKTFTLKWKEIKDAPLKPKPRISKKSQ